MIWLWNSANVFRFAFDLSGDEQIVASSLPIALCAILRFGRDEPPGLLKAPEVCCLWATLCLTANFAMLKRQCESNSQSSHKGFSSASARHRSLRSNCNYRTSFFHRRSDNTRVECSRACMLSSLQRNLAAWPLLHSSEAGSTLTRSNSMPKIKVINERGK